MKRIILSLTFLITSLFAYSQKDTIYYNAELLIVDSLRATFYRVCKVNYYERRIEGMFSDYNYWTRKRIAEGNYTLGEKNGTFKTYNDYGELKSKAFYSKGKRVDTWEHYNEKGKLVYKLRFKKFAPIFVNVFDSLNKEVLVNGNGELNLIENSYKITGTIKKLRMNGIWTLETGGITFKEDFKNGVFKSGVLSTNDNSDKYYKSKILGFIIDTHHFDLTGEYRTASCCYNKQPFAPIEYYYSFKKKNQINERFDETNHSIKDTTTNNSSTYSIVEEMPIFPGGEIELFKFLSKNLKAPNTLERGGIVYVTFVINKQGLIEQPKILRGLTDECDTEVLRVLNLMPKWLPGKQRGVPVKVQYNLPIRFSPSMK